MSRSRGARPTQPALMILIGLLLALGIVPNGAPRSPAAARQAPTPAASVPLHLLAATTGTLPAPDADLVWLVQRGALFGERRAVREPFPLGLGFVLGRRGTLALLDAGGSSLAEVSSGRAVPLPRDMGGAFASGTGDVALYVQIALVPASALPPRLPPQSAVSAAFRAAAEAPIALELVRGFVNPGQAAFAPPAAAPSLLLATDNHLRLEDAAGAELILVRDESALLAGAATIRNDGPHPASFVAARVMANPIAAATPRASLHPAQPLDPVVEEAWRRNGCHLNPANPACATVAVAAACASDPTAAACAADGDGDGCADVPEIRAAFNPFDPADCIAGGDGAPAVNCLFLIEALACDGRHDGGAPPPDPCALAPRDPLCDGFAPERG